MSEIKLVRGRVGQRGKSCSPQMKTTFSVQLKKNKTKDKIQSIQSVTSKKLNPKSQFTKKQYFKPTAPDNTLKYFLGPGNNDQLIKRVMAKRTSFKESTDSSSMFVNFKWQQSDQGYRFERLIQSQFYKQLVNHFEHHREISNKQYLIKNLTEYCEKHKMNVFDFTPITFVVDFSDENCDFNITQFLKAYEQHSPKKLNPKSLLDVKRRLRGNFTNDYQRESSLQYTKIQMSETFLASEAKYLWLIKPTFLNRGRGIKIFDDLEQLVSIIQQFQEGIVQKQPGEENKKSSSNNVVLRANAFVVQKYIERPALINKRKFDIRVWGLVTHRLDAYFFSEGYIRTSSVDFNLDLDNQFVHFTNNAIQKYSNNYGQFEDGNQMSFNDYQKYLNQQGVNANVNRLVDQMKQQVWMVFNSVRTKLNYEDRKFCFEIFGFDFFLDEQFNLWLIEVNTNPCIEESSPLLGMYIPRMLDDAFKLTLDILFPNSVDPIPFPVAGYENDENMWFLLGSLNNDRLKTKKKK